MALSPHLPDLDALALLVAVSQQGSIGGAARVIGVSQQTASERLAGMERQIGVALLVRGARGSRLTPAGTVLVEWAARLLQVAEEVDASIAALRTARDQQLHVAASMTIAEHLMPRWLVAFRQRSRSPGADPVAVSLVASNSADVITTVLAGSADVGFVEGPARPTGIRSAEIATDELIMVAAPGDPLTRRRRPLTAAEVASLALTSREPGSGTRDVVDRALTDAGWRLPAPAMEVSTSTGVREAIRAGGAPGFLSQRTVQADLDSGSLREIPTTGLALQRKFRAVWVGGARPPAGPVRDLLAVARVTG